MYISVYLRQSLFNLLFTININSTSFILKMIYITYITYLSRQWEIILSKSRT